MNYPYKVCTNMFLNSKKIFPRLGFNQLKSVTIFQTILQRIIKPFISVSHKIISKMYEFPTQHIIFFKSLLSSCGSTSL